MKILEFPFKHDSSFVKTCFQSENIAFIDIETDGLSHKNKIVLIGLVLFSTITQQGIVIQLFNDDYQSERDLLKELFHLLKVHNIHYFISFNGDAFDFPFINARLRALKLNLQLNKAFNIDLLRIVRKHKTLFPIESYSLKSIEYYLGIERTDTISGKDSVILYHSFIESRDPKLEKMILLHNFDDIINMVPLLNIFKTIPFNTLYKKCVLEGKEYFLTAFDFKRNDCKIILSHPFISSSLEGYYETLGSSMKQSIAGIELTFEVQFLKMNSGDTTLTILNTKTVFDIDFLTLDQTQKESFLLAVNQQIHWQNVLDIIKKIYNFYTIGH